MYPPNTYYRRDSLTNHPPYGLYLDPHRGQHTWTAAGSRLLLAILGLVGSILIVVITLGPHLIA
jgi:hypothetical protein